MIVLDSSFLIAFHNDAAIAAVARRHPPGLVATFDDDFSALDGITVVP